MVSASESIVHESERVVHTLSSRWGVVLEPDKDDERWVARSSESDEEWCAECG